MKRKLFFSALVSLAVVTACTNEDFELSQQPADITAGLVQLEGLEFNVASGDESDPMTRLTTDGKWEASDEVGVGFVNWPLTSGGTGTYSEGTWSPTVATWANAITDGNIYANHRLYQSGDAWKFETVVYEGLHYAYYPLQEHVTVSPLTVELGNVQTAGEEDAFITNGLFAISPLYDLRNDAAGKAPNATFTLNTISNRIKFNIELADAGNITDPIIIKSVTLTAKNTGSNVSIFAPKAEIVGGKVPVAYYTEQIAWKELEDGNAGKTEEALAEAISADKEETDENFAAEILGDNTPLNYSAETARTSAITTTVKNHTGLTATAKTYGVNLFTFPVSDDAIDALEVTVETNYGTVTIESGATENPAGASDAKKAIIKANNEKLANLIKALKGTITGTNADKANLKKYGNAVTVDLKLDMSESQLAAINVANATEWADAVKIASQVSTVKTINVTDNVTASLTDLPTNVNKIDIATGKTFTVSGDIQSVLNFEGDGTLKVAAETALNVKGQMLKKTAVTVGAVENYGTINIDEYSSMESTADKVINNHGEFINNGTLTLTKQTSNQAFVNCKHATKTNGGTNNHDCRGILRNNGSMNGSDSGTAVLNDGVFYQGGTCGGNLTFSTTAESGSQAISVNGGALPATSGEKFEAYAFSTAEFEAALAADATTIYITGSVAFNQTLDQATTTFVLEEGGNLYVMEEANVNSKTLNITAKGANLIQSAASVYLDINELKVEKDAVLTIGAEGDTYAEKTAINVAKLNTPAGSKIINNGWVYAASAEVTNAGTWEGMAVNTKEKSATDSKLIAIEKDMASR